VPRLEVRVVDYNTGKPISRAYVSVNSLSAYTDFNGYAVFIVPSGVHVVRVLKAGYSAHRMSVAVFRDSRLEVRLVPLVSIL